MTTDDQYTTVDIRAHCGATFACIAYRYEGQLLRDLVAAFHELHRDCTVQDLKCCGVPAVPVEPEEPTDDAT